MGTVTRLYPGQPGWVGSVPMTASAIASELRSSGWVMVFLADDHEADAWRSAARAAGRLLGTHVRTWRCDCIQRCGRTGVVDLDFDWPDIGEGSG